MISMISLLLLWFDDTHLSVGRICRVILFLNLSGSAAIGSILSTIDPLKPAENVIGFLENVSPVCVQARGECPRKLVTFWLYTSDNKSNPVEIDLSCPSRKARWLPDCDFKIIIHGYRSDKNSDCVQALVTGYLDDECRCHNVVVIDWSPLCRTGCYFVALQNLNSVAICVRELIVAVTDNGVLNNPRAHVIGHSLGAHIASRSSLYATIYRVTELDPAGPIISPNETVTPRSNMSDVHHTNAGGVGQRERSGKVDIYYNNGTYQPGCGCDIGCSHLIVCRYLAESINCCKPILALRSDGGQPNFSQPLVALGECMDPTVSGVFTVLTSKSPPFLPDADRYNFTSDAEGRSRYDNAVDAHECRLQPLINTTFDLINKS